MKMKTIATYEVKMQTAPVDTTKPPFDCVLTPKPGEELDRILKEVPKEHQKAAREVLEEAAGQVEMITRDAMQYIMTELL